MKRLRILFAGIAVLMVLDACVSKPLGPQVAVMPGPNKPFAVFQDDQVICKNYADQQVAGGAEQANTQQLGAAALGTVLGAGLGAAVGGGQGAAVGAGTGAIAGTAVGAGPAERAQMSLQQRYDIAYVQCMYARGNQVPGYATAPAPTPTPPPPPSAPAPRS